jgi:hypothetical protein
MYLIYPTGLMSITQENSIDLGSQNPSRSLMAIKLQLKPDILQFRKHYAEVQLVFVCAS